MLTVSGCQQSDRARPVNVVVDLDDVVAGFREQARGRAGPEAAGAVHPDTLGRDRAKTAGQLMERNVEAARQRALGAFLGPPHVQHDIAGPPVAREVVEGTAGEAARCAELADRGAGPGDVVEADAGELAPRLLKLSGAVADEDERRAERD